MAAVQWVISATLLCSLVQGSNPDGVKPQSVVQKLTLRPSPGPYESAFHHTSEGEPNLLDNSTDADKQTPKQRAVLPSLPCTEFTDCAHNFDDPFLVCREGQCDCRHPYCWVYRREVLNIWTAQNVFTCGTCGVLGSWCNDSLTCDFPGDCWSDGYCHCPRGENKDNICLTTDDSWTFKVTMIGMGLVLLFAAGLVMYNCYIERPWSNPQSCWRKCCTKGRVGRHRRGSCEKSPAFSIQNHYSSQLSTLEDNHSSQPSVETGAVPRHNSRGRARRTSGDSSEDGINNSLSSASTTATIISDSSSTLQAQDSLAGVAPAQDSAASIVAAWNSSTTVTFPSDSTTYVASARDPNDDIVRTRDSAVYVVPVRESSADTVLDCDISADGTYASPSLASLPVPLVVPSGDSDTTKGVHALIPKEVTMHETRPSCSDNSSVMVSNHCDPKHQAVPEIQSVCRYKGNTEGSSHCNHERCNLCLPKALTTRPPMKASSDITPQVKNKQSPYFPRIQERNESIIEFTRL